MLLLTYYYYLQPGAGAISIAHLIHMCPVTDLIAHLRAGTPIYAYIYRFY